jgi:hypothetical protein
MVEGVPIVYHIARLGIALGGLVRSERQIWESIVKLRLCQNDNIYAPVIGFEVLVILLILLGITFTLVSAPLGSRISTERCW